MPRYLIQVRSTVRDGLVRSWQDIVPGGATFNHDGKTWEASSPQDAFAKAMASGQDAPFEDDGARPLVEGEYRVLPFGGGATFRVGVNVDETVHEDQREAVAHGR